MKRLQGPKVPPRWRKSILQEATAALTGRLEELDVAPQPRLERDRQMGGEKDRCVDRTTDRWTDRQTGGQRDRRTSGWTNRQTGGWIERQVSREREQGIDELLISFLP